MSLKVFQWALWSQHFHAVFEILEKLSWAFHSEWLQWRRSFKSLLFGESSFSHGFQSWPKHLFRERDHFNRDATHYSCHHHNNIGQGIESWESNSCERSSIRLIMRKRRRFSLGQPLNYSKVDLFSCFVLNIQPASGGALKKFISIAQEEGTDVKKLFDSRWHRCQEIV
jgi:hypothetical protein